MSSRRWVPAVSLMAITSIAAMAAAADRSASGPVEGPPGEWLSGTDKSEEWRAATQRSRELLGKLDLQTPLVQKHLAKVKEKVELLLRSLDFDWRKKTAVEYLQDLLEDLAAGKEPLIRYAGKGFAYPYWSKALRRIEAMAIKDTTGTHLRCNMGVSPKR